MLNPSDSDHPPQPIDGCLFSLKAWQSRCDKEQRTAAPVDRENGSIRSRQVLQRCHVRKFPASAVNVIILFRQMISQVVDHLFSFIHFDDMFRHKFGEITGIHPARQIVP
jgi:hypothetical protein